MELRYDFHSYKNKKNWSSPGTDMICNYWWKYITAVRRYIVNIFVKTAENTNKVPDWFTVGRTILLKKPGSFSIGNHRDITCLQTVYKWYTIMSTPMD